MGIVGVIHHSQSSIVVSSLIPFLKSSRLLHPNFVHDEDFIVFLDLLPQEACNCLIIRLEHKSLPVEPPNAESAAVLICLIDKFGTFVVCYVVSSYQHVIVNPQDICLFPIDLKPNIYSSWHEKDDFIDLIKLVEYNFILMLDSGLKNSQKVKHKVWIHRALPREKRRLVNVIVVSEAESSLVVLKEIFEQEVFIHYDLGVYWQLLENGFILWVSERSQFVFLPSEFEMLLNFLFQALINRLISVVGFHSSEEKWKQITLF